jgi:hypothetical protein
MIQSRAMSEQVLSAVERNQVCQMIRERSLHLADFEWTTQGHGDELKEVIAYPRTNAWFEFSHWNRGGYRLRWRVKPEPNQQSKFVVSWHEASRYMAIWLSSVNT